MGRTGAGTTSQQAAAARRTASRAKLCRLTGAGQLVQRVATAPRAAELHSAGGAAPSSCQGTRCPCSSTGGGRGAEPSRRCVRRGRWSSRARSAWSKAEPAWFEGRGGQAGERRPLDRPSRWPGVKRQTAALPATIVAEHSIKHDRLGYAPVCAARALARLQVVHTKFVGSIQRAVVLARQPSFRAANLR